MKSRCASCKVCQYAQSKPDTLIGKLWLWHSKWCPMWKAYEKELAKESHNGAADQTENG